MIDDTDMAPGEFWADFGVLGTPERPSWDDYFLGIALAVSARADCRRAKHGCVIVDAQRRVVSTGYNSAAAGESWSCLGGDCPRGLLSVEELAHFVGDYSNCRSMHAEMAAVAWGDGTRMRGGTAYLTGTPCQQCFKLLKAAGILQAVWPDGRADLRPS